MWRGETWTGRAQQLAGAACVPASVRAGSEYILYFQNTQCDSEPRAQHTDPAATWRPANTYIKE